MKVECYIKYRMLNGIMFGYPVAAISSNYPSLMSELLVPAKFTPARCYVPIYNHSGKYSK